MGEDLIDFLIENPQEIPAALEIERKKYGRDYAERLEAAIATRKRLREKPDTKGIAEMIDAGTRTIAGEDYYFGTKALNQPEVTRQDVRDIAKIINQGTQDVISHPNLPPEQAVRFGQLERRIKGE